MPIINKMIQRNSVSQILEVFAVERNATDDSVNAIPHTNVVVKYFYRGKAGAFLNIPVIANVGGADVWESGAWRQIDGTNLKGVYQFGIPNAVLASSEKEVLIKFSFTATAKEILYQITLTDMENVLLANEGLDSVIIENQINLTANGKKALQVIMAAVAGATVGAGSSVLEFKPTGADQSDVAFRVKATMDTNNDRSVIEYG